MPDTERATSGERECRVPTMFLRPGSPGRVPEGVVVPGAGVGVR